MAITNGQAIAPEYIEAGRSMGQLDPHDLHCLSRSSLLRTAGRDTVDEIANYASAITVPAGTRLTSAGDYTEMLYGVVDGLVRVELQTPLGVRMEPLSAPEICGWTGLIPPYHHFANAVTATECRLVAIHASHLRTMIARHDTVSALLLEQLARLSLHRLEDIVSLLEGRAPFSLESPT